MSLKEHTRVRLESRGKLTKIGQIVVDSFNEMARAHFAGELLPNHTPASPAFWFHGLAREHAAPFGQFESDAPMASEAIRACLTDEAIILARDVLRCSCDYKWGSWEMNPNSHDWEDGEPFACYPCAFDAHGMCVHGCNANFEVLRALDADMAARGLPPHRAPRFVAKDQSLLEEAAAHVLRYGKLGKQSKRRLAEALEFSLGAAA